MTFLSLAFLRKAFAVPDLTPKRLYNLKVPAGQGQQLIPWNDEMNDTCVFRKLNRTALGVEFSDDHMPYSTLRPRLLNFGEVTGIALPVGSYSFRRGNGEALDSSSTSSVSSLSCHSQQMCKPNRALGQALSVMRNVTYASCTLPIPRSSNVIIFLGTSQRIRIPLTEDYLRKSPSCVTPPG